MTLYRRGHYWWSELKVNSRTELVCTHQTHRGLALAAESRMRVALAAERQKRQRQTTRHGNKRRRQRMTLGEAVDRYIETVLLAKTPAYGNGVEEWVAGELYRTERLLEHFGYTTSLLQVAKWASISEFNRRLLQTMKRPSANRYLSALRAVLNKAYEWGELDAPAYVRLNRARSQRHRFLTSDEERRLIAACAESIKDFVILLLDTGARVGEAQRLTWRHINLARMPRPAVTFVDTKNGENRSVPLPKRAEEMMLRQRKTAVAQLDEPVFTERARKTIITKYGETFCRRGDRIPLSNLSPLFIRARRSVGLEDVRLHDLRHTYASRLVRAGVPLFEVAKLLGHRQIEMTMRYSHLTVDTLDAAVAALDCDRPSAQIAA
jgi:integrase